MNIILIILFIVIMGPQTVWAKPAPVRIDSLIFNSISSEELQKVPSEQRNPGVILNLPAFSSSTPSSQADINFAQDKLKDDLKYFSDPSRRQPANLNSAIKEYLSHAPQDTQYMIDKLDVFKASSGYLYGKDTFSGYNSLRSMSILPQELPKPSEFIPQEQIWEKQNLPFGRLGITKDGQGWGFGLST